MKLFEKKNFVKIEKEDLKDAKLSSAGFSDETTQKRAFVDVLGARLAIKMLFSKKIEANNVYSLYTIQNVLKDLDIADIYYSGIKIDVRLVFNREEIFVPKSHFQHDLLPDVYLILELKQDFSGAEFIGFFEPKNLNQDNVNKDFYFQDLNELQEPDNLKKFLNDFVPEPKNAPSKQDLEKAEILFLSTADNEISEEDKIFLFKQLADSFDLREKFVEFENFEIISKKVVQNDEIFQDGILGIVGAQQLFEDEEVATSEQEIKAEVIEEVLSDLIEPDETEFEIIEDIEEIEESKSLDEDDDDFMKEFFGEDDSSETDLPTDDKGNSSMVGGATLGAIAGAVAGGVVAGGVASAAVGITSGIATQEAVVQAGAELLSSGLKLAENLTNDTPDVLLNMVESEESFAKADFVEEENENLNLSDFTEEADVPENAFSMDELDELEELNLYQEEENAEIIETEESLVEDDESGQLEVSDEFSQIENEIVSELPMGEIEELKIDESFAEDTLKAFAPLEEVDVIEDNTLPAYALGEENIPSEDLLGGLPELTLGFDDVEPDYLKTFQQEDGLSQPQEFFAPVEEVKIEEENIAEPEEFEDDSATEKADSDDGYFLSEPEPTIEDSKDFENEIIAESEFLIDEVDENKDIEPDLDLNSENDNSDNADSVISEVDAFLKNMDFGGDSSVIGDTELDNINLDFLNEEILNEDVPVASAPAIDDTEIETGFETKANTLNDDSLQVLFNEDRLDIDEMFPTGKKIVDFVKKDKKVAIAASIAGVMLVSFIAGGVIISAKSTPEAMPQQDVAAVAQLPTDRTGMAPDGLSNEDPRMADINTQGESIPLDSFNGQPQAQVSKDMSQAVSDAFLSEPVNANITKVAWEVPEDLAYNDGFRKYLQMAGKNLKLNLQNDLLLANEMAYSNKVILDLVIGRDGSLTSSTVVSSSGSKQIDRIVLQSVKNTIMYLKMPPDELSGDSADVTLIINF